MVRHKCEIDSLKCKNIFVIVNDWIRHFIAQTQWIKFKIDTINPLPWKIFKSSHEMTTFQMYECKCHTWNCFEEKFHFGIFQRNSSCKKFWKILHSTLSVKETGVKLLIIRFKVLQMISPFYKRIFIWFRLVVLISGDEPCL